MCIQANLTVAPRLHSRAFFVLTLLLATLLSGCAVGPDFRQPEAPRSTAYTPQPLEMETASAPVLAGNAQKYNAAANIPADWWTLFRSPAIHSLITRAFNNNPSNQDQHNDQTRSGSPCGTQADRTGMADQSKQHSARKTDSEEGHEASLG